MIITNETYSKTYDPLEVRKYIKESLFIKHEILKSMKKSHDPFYVKNSEINPHS